MAAMLMAIDDPDGGPILVLAPKPLLQQWQDELMELLLLPSARWNGRAWVDENDLEYPSEGSRSLGKCPRRIGLVSQGLVVRGLREAVNQLLGRQYTCVIVDEAHRARRRKMPKVDAGADEMNDRGEPNKLMAFLREIGQRRKACCWQRQRRSNCIQSRHGIFCIFSLMGMTACSAGGHKRVRGISQAAALRLPPAEAVPTEMSRGLAIRPRPTALNSEDPGFDRIRRNLDADDRMAIPS